MTALASSCGNAENEWYAFPNHRTWSLPRLLSTHSWASLGIVADVLSQFINNCFILVDSKDEIMLTFFTADEINC